MHRTGVQVLGSFIDALTWDETMARIGVWSAERRSRVICICNVHSVVTARSDSVFRRVLAEADMATPDGMPVAWMLRHLGFPGQNRINGPDLMWKYCAMAEARNESIYLYGNTPQTLSLLQTQLSDAFPRLRVAGMHSPQFRPLTTEEDVEETAVISASGANVLFVGLGCPKQELWMDAHRGRIPAVMIGVGAAFDYHAGTVKRAPHWMQHNGLEWVHRLWSQPHRLWRRYLVTNTRFLVCAMRQLLLRR